MSINWSDIRYIFQLPLQWFKSISDKVFNAYGTNFLTVKDGMYGGMEFSINEDEFNDAVNRAVDLSSYATIDDLSTYVTLSTDQTIVGEKTFTSDIILKQNQYTSAIKLAAADARMILSSERPIDIDSSQFVNIRNSLSGSRLLINLSYGALEIFPPTDKTYGGIIDFHYQGSTSDYTSRLAEGAQSFYLQSQDKNILIRAIDTSKQVILNAAADGVVLQNHPTLSTTTSKAVATVGYCQSNFGKVKTVNGTQPDSDGNVAITIPTQIVKTVDHKSPDASGNIQLNAIRTINGHNGDSVGNFAGVVTSINGNTPTDGAVTMTVVESVDGVSPDANGNVQLDTVKSVDGHSPDQDGAVSFGLTASKWVKTDSSGHLTTTDDTPVSIPSNKTGQTTNITLVTGVTWDGTQLVVARRQLNFTNGVLTGTTSQSNTTIATVAYT